MKTRIVVIVVLCLPLLGGCIQVPDPITGVETTVIAPETIVALDTAAEAAPGIAGLLSLLAPGIGTAGAGVLIGLAGMWKRMKPKVIAAKNEAGIYHAATESIVAGIEQWKENNLDAWNTLRESLGDSMGSNTEAVIRAIRNLPPKN